MKLLETFKDKKVNIFFSEDSLFAPLWDVTLKDIGSNFFKVESDNLTVNKIFAISSIVSIEEREEQEPYHGPTVSIYSGEIGDDF